MKNSEILFKSIAKTSGTHKNNKIDFDHGNPHIIWTLVPHHKTNIRYQSIVQAFYDPTGNDHTPTDPIIIFSCNQFLT